MYDEIPNRDIHYTEIVSHYLNAFFYIFYIRIRNIESNGNNTVMNDIHSIIP